MSRDSTLTLAVLKATAGMWKPSRIWISHSVTGSRFVKIHAIHTYNISRYCTSTIQQSVAVQTKIPPTVQPPSSLTKPPLQTFYKRPLPTHLIPFSSQKGRELFKEALKGGAMESYWTLAEQFHTQSEPAYCGLATLAMVLNALQIDPNRPWKGPWRWFSEDLLDCCTPLEIVKKEGITFSYFGCLAKCNGAEVQSIRADQISLEDFRKYILQACTTEGLYLVVSFSRGMLGQTGDGHFSAISGYHKEQDLVLVMDTAKFKYPAFWCPVPLLYEAMLPKDKATNQPRGLFLLHKSEQKTLQSSDQPSWSMVSHYLLHKLPLILKESKPTSVVGTLQTVFKYFPKELYQLINQTNATSSPSPPTENQFGQHDTEKVIQEMAGTKMYQHVQEALQDPTLAGVQGLTPENATLLILSSPSQLYKELPSELRTTFKELRDIDSLPVELSKQVIQLRYQMLNMAHSCSCKTAEEAIACNQ